MQDLWFMKARAFVVTRPGAMNNDLRDFIWLTGQMALKGIQYDPIEILKMILDELRARRA